MHVVPIKTPRIAPNDSLMEILDTVLPPLENGSIVAVTSKIISLCQGRVMPKGAQSKDDLVFNEADAVADVPENPYGLYITLKDNILIPSAGIDESNGDNVYILYPQNIHQSAAEIWSHLRKQNNIEQLGIVVTDSHVAPLRHGVTGFALSWCGFAPLHDYIGTKDLYGQEMKVTKINLPDALAAAAVLVMGEGDESTPLAVLNSAPKIRFQDHPPTPEEISSLSIPLEQDLFAPVLTQTKWIKRAT